MNNFKDIPWVSQLLFILSIIIAILSIIVGIGSFFGMTFYGSVILAYVYGIAFWAMVLAVIFISIAYIIVVRKDSQLNRDD